MRVVHAQTRIHAHTYNILRIAYIVKLMHSLSRKSRIYAAPNIHTQYIHTHITYSYRIHTKLTHSLSRNPGYMQHQTYIHIHITYSHGIHSKLTASPEIPDICSTKHTYTYIQHTRIAYIVSSASPANRGYIEQQIYTHNTYTHI